MTMTSKNQEREVLKKIRKIVEELGEDSYVGTTFEGAWELAEENIENDFASSCAYFIGMTGEHEKTIRRLTEEADSKEKRLCQVLEEKDREIEALKSKIEEQEERIRSEHRRALEETSKNGKFEGTVRTLEAELHDRDMTIMELKAKLYDMMVKKEGK